MESDGRWRLIEYSHKDPAFNLAIEEAMLRYHLEENGPCTIRLWMNPPSVILGRFQGIDGNVNLKYCVDNGIKVLRRVSGGGAVYHDYGNLNYTLIIPNNLFNGVLKDVKASYHFLCSGVIVALRSLGVKAVEVNGNITINGKKISGSAQYRLYHSILHHGTLMIKVNINQLGKALNIKNPKKYLTNLSEHLPYNVSLSEISDAIVRAYESVFGTKFSLTKLSTWEVKEAIRLYKIKYSKTSWNIEG